MDNDAWNILEQRRVTYDLIIFQKRIIHEVMAFDSGQGNGHMGMPKVLNHTRIRVQGRTPSLPDGPRLGSLHLFQFVAARQATVIGRDEIATLTLRNGRQEIPPVIGKHAACAFLVKPVNIPGPTKKNPP